VTLVYDADGIVMHFRKDLDMNNIEELKEFIAGHTRYSTMNSWNRTTSYANRVKLPGLPLTHEQEMTAFGLLEVDEFWERVREIQDDWAKERKYKWQTGFNGRSSGHIVLYRGGKHENGDVFTMPGQGVDEELDFEGWELLDYQDKAKFILEFDLLCDLVLTELVYCTDNYDVKEQVRMRPEAIHVMVEK
jgi:hypothetical protein